MLSRIIPQHEELVALGIMSIRTKSTDKRNRKCQRKEPKYHWKEWKGQLKRTEVPMKIMKVCLKGTLVGILRDTRWFI